MLGYILKPVKGILLLTFILLATRSTAQTDNVDFQTWTDLTYSYNIRNKIDIGADAGVRGIVSSSGEWAQLYIRPSFRYFFNRVLRVAGSVAVFSTQSKAFDNTREFRISEEASAAWPTLEFIHFYHRIRFEQRFFSYQRDSIFGINLANDFKVRGRYQFSLETLDIQLGEKYSSFYFMAGWELFYSFNNSALESFINNQRYFGGIGHRITPKFKYELQYIYQKSRAISDNGFEVSEHILRLRLFLLSRSAK